MPGHGEILANPIQQSKLGESLVPTIEFYFGIFFDGTNNNKLQVMLGKRYRREQYLKDIIERANKFDFSYEQICFLLEEGIIDSFHVQKYSSYQVSPSLPDESRIPTYATVLDSDVVYNKDNINKLPQQEYVKLKTSSRSVVKGLFESKQNGNCLVRKGRSFWENKGILSQSQMDQLFFGYEDESDEQYFIEKRISKQLDNKNDGVARSKNIGWDRSEKTEHFSFASEDAATNMRIKAEADSLINEDDQGGDTNYSSPSQSPTYTNVVILESLYDASLAHNDSDGNIIRKYYSIYVEGSGSDMKFYPPVFGHIHLMGPGLFGLGKGTGDSGAVAKVMKMSRQVKSIISGFSGSKKVYFDIFGFSRGATEARMFNYLVNPKKDEAIGQKLKKVSKKNRINDYKLFTGSSDEYLKNDNIIEKKVRFLGIYDTVSSIGILREGWLTSTIKESIINTVGNLGNGLDFVFNKHPEYLSRAKDKVSAMFLRLLYEKTINHPEQMANVLLSGFSPDFFTQNHQLGTEDILSIIIDIFPFDKLPESLNSKPIIEALRDGIKTIRVNYVEKYEDYVNEKHLDCMEEPDVSIFGKSKYHDENVDDYGLFTTNQAEEVFHICALDEVRSNFALVDIESSVLSNGLELFIPGCHTDIGGGTGLGRDDQKIANISASNGTPNYVCKTKPFDKKLMEYVPLSSAGLMLAGWIDTFDNKVKGGYLRNVPTDDELGTEGTVYSDNADSWIHTPNIIMNRYVQPGYSNIGLHLMQERANGKGRAMFKEIPDSYKVPKDLKEDYYDIILSKIKNLPNGRVFVNPTSGKYRELRHEWIHYSANEQILSLADNILVNPPNYVGAFINDRKKTSIENCLILKGDELNTNKQEHPFIKTSHNITKALLNPRTYLFSFPFNASTAMNAFAMTDAMFASRIIYRGRSKEDLSSLNTDASKPYYMFDYVQGGKLGGKLIDVSLKNKNNELYLRDLISILEVEKERAQRFIEMCIDMQIALGKIQTEEMFHIANNTVKLLANNIDVKTDTIQIKRAGTAILFLSNPTNSNDPENIRKVLAMNIQGKLSVGDIAGGLIDSFTEEYRKDNGISDEASNAFIDYYTTFRDWITAVVPENMLGTHWASWWLINAPEIGKIFGHTAALIHIYSNVSDWKKQEEFGRINKRVLEEQIIMIKNDLDS